jgi:hypothetical protein
VVNPGPPDDRQQPGLADAAPNARNALLWTLAGTALGLTLLYAATRKVDAAALAATLRSVDWPWIGVILAATIAFCAIKAWRWGLLLIFVRSLSFRELHAAVYAGLAVNFLVAHVGEFLRAATIARNRRVSMSAVLASVVVERVLDFVALLLLLTLIGVAVPDRPAAVTTAAMVSAFVVIVMLGGLVVLLHPPPWSVQLASRLGRLLTERLQRRLIDGLDSFRAGLAAMHNPACCFGQSSCRSCNGRSSPWLSGRAPRAVGLSATLIAATVTLVVIVVGLALPNSPLQLGATQLAFVVGLGTDGTGATPAIAASLVYTSFLILPVMLAGGFALLRRPESPGGTP